MPALPDLTLLVSASLLRREKFDTRSDVIDMLLDVLREVISIVL